MANSVPKGTHFVGSNAFLQQVYSATSTDQTRDLYDKWAIQYDKDLAEEDYASPELSVQAVVKHLDRSRLEGELQVLDAGCGTGLVGICLSSAKTDLGNFDLKIDGLDLSQGMLDVARKTMLYGELEVADLTKPLSIGEESYDVVTCVGTLTKAHVGAGVLREFVRIARRGWGLIVATVLDDIWESGGYKAVMEDMEKFGKIEVIGTEEFGIRKSQTTGGRMIVLRRKYLAQEIAHAGIGA